MVETSTSIETVGCDAAWAADTVAARTVKKPVPWNGLFETSLGRGSGGLLLDVLVEQFSELVLATDADCRFHNFAPLEQQ